MPTCSPNTTVTATAFAAPQTLLNATGAAIGTTAGTDQRRYIYTVHNRDATNYVRVAAREMSILGGLGNWINDGTDGGAAVAPGATVQFASKKGLLGLVQVWTEGGTPIIDGYSQAV